MMSGSLDAKADALTRFQDQSDDRQGAKCTRVLIIEDDDDCAESLRELLTLADAHREVEVARNGLAGIAAAERLRPDLVICDIGLPEMDGYQVVRALRRQPALSAARILALTGYARPEDIRRCVEAGFNGHMAKPLTPEQLSSLVQDGC